MPKAFEAIRLFKMRAGNFTMPCKNIAAKLVDKLSPAAEIIGACNAFVNDNGVITGYITDGVGFVKNLEINGVSVKDKKDCCTWCRWSSYSYSGSVSIGWSKRS